jgi:hypothetical protein
MNNKRKKKKKKDPISKIPFTKKGWWSGSSLSSNPSTTKNPKKPDTR